MDLGAENSATVQDGDIVNVTSIIDRFQNAVTLRGNVANPGRFVWHQGMRISDLIPDREMLITRNYYQKLDQLGQNRSQNQLDQNQPGQNQSQSQLGQIDQTMPALGPRALSVSSQDRRVTSAAARGTVGASPGGSSVGAATHNREHHVWPRPRM